MEKSSPFLIAAITLMEIIIIMSSSPFSLICIISLCSLPSWIITLYNFYSWICSLLHTTLHSLSTSQVPGENLNVIDTTNTASKHWPDQENNYELSRGEVEVVMGKLGIVTDPSGDELGVGSNDIAALLEEEGLGLEDVREAFGVFDENCDGFIDASELEKIISALGFREQVSKEECQRMIEAFDDDGDGKIDMIEFVKLLENSS